VFSLKKQLAEQICLKVVPDVETGFDAWHTLKGNGRQAPPKLKLHKYSICVLSYQKKEQ